MASSTLLLLLLLLLLPVTLLAIPIHTHRPLLLLNPNFSPVTIAHSCLRCCCCWWWWQVCCSTSPLKLPS
jgi:hypothetical protein